MTRSFHEIESPFEPGRFNAPYDRDRTGGKHHLVTDASGIPLAVSLSGGDRSDVMQFVALLGAVPPVRGRRGRPRCRPGIVFGDCGDDHGKDCRLVCSFGVKPVIVRRGTEYGLGLGTQHWAVERAFGHLHWFRRLRIGWETRGDVHEAFLTLGCSLIGWRRSVSSL
ncbi:transposase [Streptomyces antibioticus]|uniref:transposase n=1 Tax=Streptomyces antibioticus TaxID=1890 RepID=UPI0036BFE299